MECPKCGHRQRDEIRCEGCGVFFSKVPSRPARPSARQISARSGGVGFGLLLLLAVAGVGAWWSKRPASESVQLPTLTAREHTADRTLAWQDAYEEMSEEELRAEKKRLDAATPSNENTKRMEWVRLALAGFDTHWEPRVQLGYDPAPRSEEERMRDEYRNATSELARIKDEAQIDEAIRLNKERLAAEERIKRIKP